MPAARLSLCTVSLSLLVATTAAMSACGETPSQRKRVRSQAALDAERAAAERAAAEQAAEQQPPPKPAGSYIEIANPTQRCRRTLCIAGPGALSEEANRNLGELCRRASGVVRECEGQDEQRSCHSAWSLDDWRRGFDAMVMSLDQDGDGKVGADDPRCSISVVGWSLGAMVAAEELPKVLAGDRRIAPDRPERAIEHMVLIAPYAPAREDVQIPASVHKAWIYRHSQAPADDCSRSFADGPWPSLPPVCADSTQCWDYDYSLEPELAFVGRQGARAGKEIGHCNIAGLVAKIAADNLYAGEQTWAEHAPRFSDGTPGGRARPEPPPPK